MSALFRICFLALAAMVPAAPSLAAPGTCGPDALGTSRSIAIDGAQKLALGLQTYPRTLALRDHEVVLTFDDGPAPTTARVLDALAEQCVRATFFLIGRNAAGAPGLVKREIAGGHSVGHHSNSHPANTLRLMSEDAAKADIDKGVAAVETAGYGAAAGGEPHTPFFRFPGFADSPALLAFLAGRGITVFGSDLWASDWREMTPQAELELTLARLDKAGKGIVLFHDSRPSTAKMLPDFLRALKQRGYHIVHMVPGPGPTPVEQAGPGWTSATEAIIAKTLGGKTLGGKSGAVHRHEAPGDGQESAPLLPAELAAPADKGM